MRHSRDEETTTLNSKISVSWTGRTLLDFLSTRFRYHTPSEWEALIQEGSVTLNGKGSSPGAPLKKNDIVSYTVVLKEPPVDRDIIILHEEETFLVACKPGNLPSHADGNFIKNTFFYILNDMLAGRGPGGRLRLVHRLDRETSGLMVVTRDLAAHRDLAGQFEAGAVEKEYLALARGALREESLLVEGAIAADDRSRISIRRRVVPDGTQGASSSTTRLEVIERFRDATLIRCVPLTGRTNQIRVHLDHIGHPLMGDKLYGRTDDQFLEFVNRARAGNHEPPPWCDAPRQMLHARRLSFRHPVNGAPLSFEAPVPDDMRRLMDSLRDAGAQYNS